MATVNFSVPQNIKDAFDREFSGQNKSGVLAALMQRAVEERQQHRRRSKAVDRLLRIRARSKPVSDRDIRAARRQGRP